MALSLTASQENILDLFTNEHQYIVPAYQRPYSWEYNQVYRLFYDILQAYGNKEDYFLGSLVLAIGDDYKYKHWIVDGQQRLVTLWLLLKACYLVAPDISKLEYALYIHGWKDDSMTNRVSSEVFEEDDQSELERVKSLTEEDVESRLIEVKNSAGEIKDYRCDSKIEYVLLCLYNWMSYKRDSQGDDYISDFIKYILDSVYLLPIELKEPDVWSASAKALTIFETINDRGMNLQDADLFKEKLYQRSLLSGNGQNFIQEWRKLKTSCDTIGISIDDLFRFYSHVLRGESSNVKPEMSLRDFFISSSDSPLHVKPYDEVLEILNRILVELQYISQEMWSQTELAAWLQLISCYTNQYPYYALVVYLFKHPEHDNYMIISLIKSLMRYCYVAGATTTVKFEIYKVICSIMQGDPVGDYCFTADSGEDTLEMIVSNNSRRMRKSYTLLAYYLENPKGLKFYSIDNILTYRDFSTSLSADQENILDSLGNMIVLDIGKKYVSFDEKCQFYSTSHSAEVKRVFNHNNAMNLEAIKLRNKSILKLIADFIRGNI